MPETVEKASKSNIETRTPRKRPERHIPQSAWRVTKRYDRAYMILGEMCAEYGCCADDMRSRSQKKQVVARRREFARRCRNAGIGRSVIAAVLGFDGSTIAAYLDPSLIEKKVERMRSLKINPGRPLPASGNYETVRP